MSLRRNSLVIAVAACAAAVPALATAATPPTNPAAPPTTVAAGLPLEPTDLGSDPALDALAQSCFSGDMAACDDLFETAPYPSPYSEYGATCAGRQSDESLAYCSEAFPPTMEPLASGAVQPGTFVSGAVVVPPGAPGTVSVALYGAPDQGGLPIIVRNDTNTAVHQIEVTAIARDATGAEIATGYAGYFAPESVVPGAWAINSVAFDAEVGADATFEFAVVYAGGTGDVISNLPIADATYQPAGQRGPEITGTVINDTGQPINSPSLYAACFDGPVLTDVHFAITDTEQIPPGGTASFTAETYQLEGDPRPCPSFAVAGVGLSPPPAS